MSIITNRRRAEWSLYLPSAIVLVGALLGACASTKHAREVPDPTGFLAEYAPLMTPGREGEANLRYRNPQADWKKYRKIILGPVKIWEGEADKLSQQDHRDLQQLGDAFYDLLYMKLSKDYEMVEKPGPGTMRIQVAILHGERSVTPVTVLSKAVPQARLPNALWTFASGKPAFAGEITIAAKLFDAVTDEVLAVGADRRVGGVNLFDKEVFNSWGDVKNSLDFWADASVYRLCVLRGGTGCVKPKA